MTSRLYEIIEDDNGHLSSTRFCMVFGVFVIAAVLFVMLYQKQDVSVVIGGFVTLCLGGYATGKLSDSSITKAGMAPPLPENKSVTLKAEGDINVAAK